ncbi:MAG: ATP-binding protein [Sedimentisphaerales bacterium]
MKLAAKLVSIIILGIIVILVVDGYISYRREIKLFEADMQLDTRSIGLAMKELVAVVWHLDGQQRALDVIEETNKGGHKVRIRWVWLDAPQNDIYAPKASLEKLDSVMRGQTATFKGESESGDKYFFSYIPIAVDKNRPGALELSESLSWRDVYARAAFIRISVLTVMLVLLSIFAVPILGVEMVGQPLSLIVDKMRRAGIGDFSVPLRLQRHDELRELAAGLNTMCEQLQEAMENVRIETQARIKALEQLRHKDRLTTVGRLASGITHELGTPLNVISGRAGMIAKGNLSMEEIIDSANIIKTQSERITIMVRQLLDFARRRSTQRALVDLRQIAQQAVNLMSPLGYKQKADLRLVAEEAPIMAKVDAEQIQQVLLNIITNALQAMPQGGKVEVGIRRERIRPPKERGGSEGNYFCIYVLDEGKGISKEDMLHIFEPFFTTKDTGEGTGLGLSIATGIVQEHGGWIDVKSECEKGSCFFIYLPQENG